MQDAYHLSFLFNNQPKANWGNTPNLLINQSLDLQVALIEKALINTYSEAFLIKNWQNLKFAQIELTYI